MCELSVIIAVDFMIIHNFISFDYTGLRRTFFMMRHITIYISQFGCQPKTGRLNTYHNAPKQIVHGLAIMTALQTKWLLVSIVITCWCCLLIYIFILQSTSDICACVYMCVFIVFLYFFTSVCIANIIIMLFYKIYIQRK